MPGNIEPQLQERVADAMDSAMPLAIHGGESKSFYGREIIGDPFSINEHCGIVDYHPTELVLRVRAGTQLQEVTDVLSNEKQMLGFEPPAFTDISTIGGVIASGLSGSARPYNGPINYFVLGVKILTGRAEILEFGGQVIKNVAGFDVSRLMVGTLGCLGVILEASIKLLPEPASKVTLSIEHSDPNQAIQFMNTLAGKPLPVSAAAWLDGVTRIRLSGSEAGVYAAHQTIGGDQAQHDDEFWKGINSQTNQFFRSEKLIIRSSLVPGTPMFCKDNSQLIDWGGGQRWFCCEPSDKSMISEIENSTQSSGGRCSHFRNGDRSAEVFAVLDPSIMRIHKNLKNAFDPKAIMNPGRMYQEL